MLKKSKKSDKIRKNNWKIINYTCMYVYMTYCQHLIKVGRKKIEKYFKSSCLRELKIKWHKLPKNKKLALDSTTADPKR